MYVCSKFLFIMIKKKGGLRSLCFDADYKNDLDCDSAILILSHFWHIFLFKMLTFLKSAEKPSNQISQLLAFLSLWFGLR